MRILDRDKGIETKGKETEEQRVEDIRQSQRNRD